MWSPHELKMTFFILKKQSGSKSSSVSYKHDRWESGDRVGPLTADRYPTGSNLTGWGAETAVKIVCAHFTKPKKPPSRHHNRGWSPEQRTSYSTQAISQFSSYESTDSHYLPYTLHITRLCGLEHTRTTLNHITDILYSNHACSDFKIQTSSVLVITLLYLNNKASRFAPCARKKDAGRKCITPLTLKYCW